MNAADLIVMTGLLEKPIWHGVGPGGSASGIKSLIAIFRDDGGGTIKVKGEMHRPHFGGEYRLHGRWVDSPKWGREFQFDTFEEVQPSSDNGLADYLSQYISSLGTHRATLIVNHFGDDTLRVLRQDPWRVAEIDGIGRATADMIAERFIDESEAIDIVAYTTLYNFISVIRPPRKIVLAMIAQWGANAVDIVKANPYVLLSYKGMGWTRVDDLAVSVLGYPRDGIDRHKAAILEAMTSLAAEGHTRVERIDLNHDTCKLLGHRVSEEAIRALVDLDELIVDAEGENLSLAGLYGDECGIVRHLRRLRAADLDPIDLASHIKGLDDDQMKIIRMFEENAVCILSGVPGSGKSHTVSLLIKTLYTAGHRGIRVVASMGRAAKRAKELIADAMPGVAIDSTTVHSALGCMLSISEDAGVAEQDAKMNRGRNDYRFKHSEDDPLEGRFFIIDETSTAGVPLFHGFVRALQSGARLLIVGDHRQLPSIEAGAVLRDLKDMVPTVILDRPYRTSGSVHLMCSAIKDGKKPSPAGMATHAKTLGDPRKDNWTHREIAGKEERKEFIVQIHINYIKKYGVDMLKSNVQVLSPQWDGILGCDSLNAAIRAIATPPDGEELGEFKVGDKVVRTRNGYETILLDPDATVEELSKIFGMTRAIEMEDGGWNCGQTLEWLGRKYVNIPTYLVNGDVGEIVGFRKGRIVVRFIDPERTCLMKEDDPKIMLFYAGTVHKMQGSQFPIIVTPLDDFFFNPRSGVGIWCNELVYTMASRTSERLITVGPIQCLYGAIGRRITSKRRTNLRTLMETLPDLPVPGPTPVLAGVTGIDDWEDVDSDIPF